VATVTTILAILGGWFAISIPIGLIVGRMLALSSPPEEPFEASRAYGKDDSFQDLGYIRSIQNSN
jgi:hypothetical protein